MIGVMETEGHGVYMQSPITLVMLIILAWLFVDDGDLVNIARTTEETGEEMINEMQKALECWIGTLRATGGDINATKSYSYVMDHKWTDSKWTFRSIHQMPGCLTINTTEGNTNITRKEPSEASKTLGVFIAPDSNRNAQMEYMQNKAKDFATEIKVKGPKTKNDYWIDLVHTIRKTMYYPLVATQLKEREWDDIMSTLHKAVLRSCGIVRTFPHAVLYGPKKFQGSGQEHPYFKQEILHIYELVKEINMNSQQGIQYRITVEQLKIEQGYPGNWTDAPYTLLSPGTTYSLIQTIWKFCYTWGISIQDNFGSIPLSRVDDEFLMPCFVTARYGKSDLKILNKGRLYLHAITLADISTIKGDTLTEQAYNGKRADQHLPRVAKTTSYTE
jgi:hypothetical protein